MQSIKTAAEIYQDTGKSRVYLMIAVLACSLSLAACTKFKSADDAKADKDNKETTAADKKAYDKPALEAVPVDVVTTARRTISANYEGTGALEPRAEAQVVAKTSGVALNVMVEEGQKVNKGDVLVRLDSDPARLQVAQTAVQVNKLQAQYNRSVQLSQQKLISANDIDVLKYDLENAKAANNLARLQLSYADVRAPISGVIASRGIKTGNFVQINSPIIRIVDDSRLELPLNVPEREFSTLKAGQEVQLLVDALPGETFTGVVDRVAPVIDAGSGTFRTIVSFSNNDKLQAGMFGRVRINYDQRENALVIPRVALLDDQSSQAVFTIKDDKAVRTPVQIGYSEGEWLEVRSGLKDGDVVVVAGKTALREGLPVLLIGKEKKAPAPALAAPAKNGK